MNTHRKRLIASTLVAGALSLGTAGLLGGGAGMANAGACPGCAPPNPGAYIPVQQGPGIPHY